MKTKYFTRYTLTDKRKKQLVFLSEMDEKQFSIIEDSVKARESITKPSNNEIREMVRHSNLSADFVIDALTIYKWTLRFLILYSEDNVEELINDIIEYCSDSIKEPESFKNKLIRIGKMIPKYETEIKEIDTKEEVLPILRSLNGTVILKPVFNERFDFEEIDIKDYKPKLIKQIACIILELKNSDDESFYVQFDSTEYEQFLNELIALQIELKTIE